MIGFSQQASATGVSWCLTEVGMKRVASSPGLGGALPKLDVEGGACGWCRVCDVRTSFLTASLFALAMADFASPMCLAEAARAACAFDTA